MKRYAIGMAAVVTLVPGCMLEVGDEEAALEAEQAIVRRDGSGGRRVALDRGALAPA
jgi:hypothetical protein